MFDPFGDFETAGYLRNTAREKDLESVKRTEHLLFRTHLSSAMAFLSGRRNIVYNDFLQVHEIIFGALYPWAGQDRAALLPDRAIIKGNVHFSHPRDCRRAVEEGLNHAQAKQQMNIRPGFIMGMFAYGHPFLDCNGRTMLIVHAELCTRARISIDWTRTRKQDYLSALTQEIHDPHAGVLDRYLHDFVSHPISQDQWRATLVDLPGLDGADMPSDQSAEYANPEVAEEHREFERRRNYALDS